MKIFDFSSFPADMHSVHCPLKIRMAFRIKLMSKGLKKYHDCSRSTITKNCDIIVDNTIYALMQYNEAL